MASAISQRGRPVERTKGHRAGWSWGSRWVLLIVFVLGVLGVVAGVSGAQAGAVFETWVYWGFVIPLVVCSGMLGLLLTGPFARKGCFGGSPWPAMYRVVVGIGLGLGAFGLVVLGLGTFHGLNPPGVSAILELAGAAAGWVETRKFFGEFDWKRMQVKAGRSEWLLLLAVVPVGMLLIAMTFPPGSLWVSEGRGYDVVEYHLEMPREYGAANSTAAVSHNVYSYLPANVEMLYLMLMQEGKWVMQDPAGDGYLWGVYPAQFLHVVMMLLAAMGVGLAPLRLGSAGRVMAVVLMLAVPWTIVTGSLAYDEGGMMLYGGLALGLAMGCGKEAWRWEGALIGILLGLAVGSKVMAGIGFALPVAGVLMLKGQWKGLAGATVVALVLYSPWAVRAAVYSGGNPLFPLASTVLPRDGWSAEQAERFTRGHRAAADEQSLSGRMGALGRELLLSEQWSLSWSSVYQWVGDAEPAEGIWWKHLGVLWMVMPVVVIGLLMQWKSGNGLGMLAVTAVVMVLGWMMLTHLQSRFLLPLLVPLAWIVGMSVEGGEGRMILLGGMRALVWAVVGCQAVCAMFLLLPEVGLLGGVQHVGSGRVQAVKALVGELFSREVNIAAIEEPMPGRLGAPLGKVLLVGNGAPFYWQGEIAYSTTFDRNLLGEALTKGGAEGAAQWLRDSGINYVVVDWREVYRLRETYGFDEAITPDAIQGLKKWGILQERQGEELGLTVLLVKRSAQRN